MDYTKYPALSRIARGEVKAHTVLKNGRVLNVFTGEILRADIAIEDGLIVGVGDYAGEHEVDLGGQYVVPGFIDAHLHMESTLVTPPRLLENTIRCGTTTYIVDPHEATNVKGWDGIEFILNQTEDVPANVYVMLPSCVPATPFEMAGCVYTAEEMAKHADHPRILGLGEVMDYVSVVGAEPGMMAKLDLFKGRVSDGHAPGLSEKDLTAYALAGIATDHEGVTFEYARAERRLGMHIHVREGSAARNVETIVRGLVESGMDTSGFSFCTDDKHIEDIRREGHISHCIRKAIALGLEPVKAYQMATINSARCYGFKHLGAIAPGYQADLVVLRDLEQVDVSAVYCKGTDTAHWHAPALELPADSPLRGTIHAASVDASALCLPVSAGESDVIGLIPGQIVTEHRRAVLPQENGLFVARDGFNKLAVIERHHETGAVGVAAITGFGLRGGAIASSVSHDSHNLLVTGDNDADMLCAVEELRRVGGGYTIVADGKALTLPLPILGLISDRPFEEVDAKLHEMLAQARRMGVPEGIDPFLTLAFLALPVIPAVRLTPRGLFDVETFSFIG